MKTLFDPADRRALLARLDDLEAAGTPGWGQMNAPQMICHVRTALRLSLGEGLDRKPTGPLARWPFNWLVIHVLPWPKGKAQSPPELLAAQPGPWEDDLAELRRLIDQFGDRNPRDDWPQSVAFGKISGSAWGVLHYKHLDHHFRQFGI
jgi:hypothetical protein